MCNVSNSPAVMVDLLFRHEGRTGQQSQKLLLVVGYCPDLVEVHQFTKRVMAQRKTKPDMDHVKEALPDQRALLALDV